MLGAPAGEYFVGVVMALMVVTAATAAGVTVGVVMVVVVRSMVLVIMSMLSTATLAVMVVVVRSVVLMLVSMLSAAALAVMVVVVRSVVLMVMLVLMLMALHHFFQQVLLHGIRLLNNLQKLGAGQLAARRGDNRGLCIVLPQQLHCLLHLVRRHHIGPAHHDGSGIFNLIVKKFTKILHVHLALRRVHNRHGAVERHLNLRRHVTHGLHHVRQLAHAGRLDNHPVRMVFGQHLRQRGSKISHQRTADASRIHFPDFNAGVLQKASVNSNLTEFIFNQHHLLACDGFLQQFLNKCSLSCSQES